MCCSRSPTTERSKRSSSNSGARDARYGRAGRPTQRRQVDVVQPPDWGREALVADFPGLTRDRQYGRASFDGEGVRLVDTGGLSEDREAVFGPMADQVEIAIDEADLVLFIVDARSGRSTYDDEIADYLRRRGVEIMLVVNKTDGVSEFSTYEFDELGFGRPLPISASHGRGIGTLKEAILDRLPPAVDDAEDDFRLRVAFVGRPNVGKSTLVNRLIGEERQVVFDQPGTTRDAIDVPFGDYLLIDTAGVRRRGKVKETVEKFSVVKTLEALDRAEVAILLLDAREGSSIRTCTSCATRSTLGLVSSSG